MSSQPSSGSEVPPTRHDRYAGLALAGFVGGLISLLLLLAALLGQGALASRSNGELALLSGGMFLLALMGLILSVLGLRSTSRRWLAIVGVVLSAMVVVSIVLLVAYAYGLYMNCQTESSGASSCL